MKKLIFSALLVLFSVCAYSGQLDSKFDGIAAQFAHDAAARSTDLAVSPAAVFPYSCDEKLAKKRVDLAVGELLTARLMHAGDFRLVERSQVDSLMKEQKLGLSGAIDSATAAQVGKLAGAKLAILGTVTRVGNAYQVSSKLVDTGSAEIISASIVEMPLETFDEEAARYLVLVPETQTLGIYLIAGNVPMSVKDLPATTAAGVPVIPGNAETGMNMDSGIYAGLGLKYFPFSRWVVDFAIIPKMKIGDTDKPVVSNLAAGMEGSLPAKANGSMLRVLVNRQFKVSPKFNFYAGGGVMRLELDPPEDETDYYTPVPLASGGTIRMKDGFGEGRYTAPLLSMGFEWKPQARFGVSMMTTFPLSSDKYSWEAVVANGASQTITVWEMNYPAYFAELNLSWYF